MTQTISQQERSRSRKVLRNVAPYLWPRGRPDVRLRVIAALTVLVLAKLIAVATPLLYKQAVDALAGDAPEGAALLGLGVIGLTVSYGLARLFSAGFQQLRDAIFARVGQGALRSLAVRTFRHIHALSLSYHLSRRTGALSRVMERGVKGVAFLLRFLIFSIGPLLLELGMICGVLVTLFDWRFLAVVVITLTLYIWFTFAVTNWRIRIRREMNERDNEAHQRAIDALLNFETVKYFAAEEREAARYDRAMAGYESAALRTAYSLAFINVGQGVIVNAGLVAVMAMATAGVARGTMTVGDFVMVNAYMIQVIMPLNFLGTVYREIRQRLVDMGEMFDLLEQPPEVVDAPGAAPLRVSGGEVVFEDLSFAYEPGRPILDRVSLRVRAGGSLAIVGATGSGKSTLGRLLFRFYEASGGAIRIDGQDLRDVTLASLHRAIGVVPQETVLFNDTIGYNIAYGRPEASREEIVRAARAAGIDDFIASQPRGYDTLVGERGLKLSGGEKQRVGIARTLLKDPPILLLDEATSALDTHTEQEIQASLARIETGRTVIMIAHRLSTIVEADQIVVLEAGRVVERGSHAELLARGGRYAGMWAVQQAATEDAVLPAAGTS
ncbi:MAG: ABCB family ABC transporter ATP-binding protein/permease [Tropicimonas sp.]|uniref:ABCB family ABC transporter ATP-binding protein/permease n=1 Tax=Tropicimonas sp. TaxID=2067044 RepID=UPI003A89E7AF